MIPTGSHTSGSTCASTSPMIPTGSHTSGSTCASTSLNANNYCEALSQAARRGHLVIVELMLSHTLLSEEHAGGTPTSSLKINDCDEAVAQAARGCHLGIVELMLTLETDDYSWAMYSVAREGHIDILSLTSLSTSQRIAAD